MILLFLSLSLVFSSSFFLSLFSFFSFFSSRSRSHFSRHPCSSTALLSSLFFPFPFLIFVPSLILHTCHSTPQAALTLPSTPSFHFHPLYLPRISHLPSLGHKSRPRTQKAHDSYDTHSQSNNQFFTVTPSTAAKHRKNVWFTFWHNYTWSWLHPRRPQKKQIWQH